MSGFSGGAGNLPKLIVSGSALGPQDGIFDFSRYHRYRALTRITMNLAGRPMLTARLGGADSVATVRTRYLTDAGGAVAEVDGVDADTSANVTFMNVDIAAGRTILLETIFQRLASSLVAVHVRGLGEESATGQLIMWSYGELGASPTNIDGFRYQALTGSFASLLSDVWLEA